MQQELADPFDGRGRDDVPWDAWRAELDRLAVHGGRIAGNKPRTDSPGPNGSGWRGL